MRATKLLLVEGLPGAGKSTLAHALLRQLGMHGIAARWWYEEVVGHPVYCFRDLPELRRVVADLEAGEHERVIVAALARWRYFAATVAAGDEVVIVDGALLGYLTWSLFPFDVSEAVILAYVAEVVDILRIAEPTVIYLRHDDMAVSWQRLCERRGESWSRGAIERATHSPYGVRHGLAGFDGLVAYWTAYRAIADKASARLPFPKLVLGANFGAWSGTIFQAMGFWGLAMLAEPRASPIELAWYVGTYGHNELDSNGQAEVVLRDGWLYLAGVPQFWPQNRLLYLAMGEYAVESFPFVARFEDGGMMLTGPPLLSGQPGGRWVRQGTDSSHGTP